MGFVNCFQSLAASRLRLHRVTSISISLSTAEGRKRSFQGQTYRTFGLPSVRDGYRTTFTEGKWEFIDALFELFKTHLTAAAIYAEQMTSFEVGRLLGRTEPTGEPTKDK